MNQLTSIKQFSDIVADTGDIVSIGKFLPNDATTNPSLLLKVASEETAAPTLTSAIEKSNNNLEAAQDIFSVEIGCSILEIIPGRISTEVDARLSFDTDATVAKARKIIALYEDAGISSERILIKIAATWEGIKAAEILERENINCNLTLVFCLTQAIACADAKAYLISPFVGRILDWHVAQEPNTSFKGEEDPGVQSVKEIYEYYKNYDYPTIVMGASFRNTGQVVSLAGCDKLTVSPNLLEQLELSTDKVERNLAPSANVIAKPAPVSEIEFRSQLNENAMAHEKLGEGIRNFVADQVKLENIFKKMMHK